MTYDNFSGYVLAGGKSSRMKTDKALLKNGDETFLERAVNNLKPVCSTIKAVINNTQKTKFETSFPSLNFVFDIYGERGAIGGIHAALKDCKSDWAIVLAVDLPLITSEAIETLAETAVKSEKIFAVVPRQADDRLQPLCAVYRVMDCLPIIEKLLGEKPSVSMRDFMQFIPIQIIEENKLKAAEDLFFNVNRPTDFHALK